MPINAPPGVSPEAFSQHESDSRAKYSNPVGTSINHLPRKGVVVSAARPTQEQQSSAVIAMTMADGAAREFIGRRLTQQANRRPTGGRKPAGGRPVERRVRRQAG